MKIAATKQLIKKYLPRKLIKLGQFLISNLRRKMYFRKLRMMREFEINREPFVAHLLVVKKKEYVRVSRVCALSFLKFHPHSRVKIHSDLRTDDALRRQFKSEILKNRVIVECDMDDYKPWQEMKIDLICSLTDQKTFYMDADLRWNGPVILDVSPTFYVKEFKIGEIPKYRDAFYMLRQQWINECTMKNTSFFSWGRINADSQIRNQVWDNYNSLVHALSTSNLEASLTAILERLSEQIAFSVSLSEEIHSVKFLKNVDAQMDGSFLESSYYGATGTSF